MVCVTVQTLSGGQHQLEIEADGQIPDLMRRVATIVGDGAARMRLVCRGQLISGTSYTLHDGDVLLAMPQRRSPPAYLADCKGEGGDDSDSDNEVPHRSTLPATMPSWQRNIAAVLRRCMVPDSVIVWLLAVKPIYYAAALLWLIGAPVAARYEMGPLYILGTLLVLMLANLGTRRPGEASAYSIFNEGVRRLPGQLTADELDRQIRHGQM